MNIWTTGSNHNKYISESKWDGVVYSQHRGRNYQSWWYHKINRDISLHTPDGSLSTFDLSNIHMAVYVRVVNKDIQKLLQNEHPQDRSGRQRFHSAGWICDRFRSALVVFVPWFGFCSGELFMNVFAFTLFLVWRAPEGRYQGASRCGDSGPAAIVSR